MSSTFQSTHNKNCDDDASFRQSLLADSFVLEIDTNTLQFNHMTLVGGDSKIEKKNFRFFLTVVPNCNCAKLECVPITPWYHRVCSPEGFTFAAEWELSRRHPVLWSQVVYNLASSTCTSNLVPKIRFPNQSATGNAGRFNWTHYTVNLIATNGDASTHYERRISTIIQQQNNKTKSAWPNSILVS